MSNEPKGAMHFEGRKSIGAMEAAENQRRWDEKHYQTVNKKPVLSPPAQSVQGADAATVIMEASEKPQTAIITSSEATIPSKAAKMPQSLFDFDDEDGTVVPYGRHE